MIQSVYGPHYFSTQRRAGLLEPPVADYRVSAVSKRFVAHPPISSLTNMNKPLEGDTAPATDRISVADHVAKLLARLQPQIALERRRDDRFPLPVLMHLVPLDDEHTPVKDESATVVGKNISRRGISFFHELPLTHRRVILELSDNELGHFTFEVDVTWCRFTKPGWYESGGRLVRVLTCADVHSTKDFTRVELSHLASDLHQIDGSFVVVNHVL